MRNTMSAASIAAEPQGERVLDRLGPALGDAPQRVLRQLLDTAALDLGVGELELHALERGERLAELLAVEHVPAGERRSPDRACRAASSRAARGRGRGRPASAGSSPAIGVSSRSATNAVFRGSPTDVARGDEAAAPVEVRPRPTAGRVPTTAAAGGRRPPRPGRRRRGPADGPVARRPGTGAAQYPALRHSAAAASSSSALPRDVEVPRSELGRGPARQPRRADRDRPRPPGPAGRHRRPRWLAMPGARTPPPRRSVRSPSGRQQRSGQEDALHLDASRGDGGRHRVAVRWSSTARRKRRPSSPASGASATMSSEHLGALLVEPGHRDPVGRRVGGPHRPGALAPRPPGRPATGRGGSG